MGRARGLPIGLLALALAGCLGTGERRSRWTDPFDLFGPRPDADAAQVQYVLIERPAGSHEINREVWDQIDEQLVPFETRGVLEETGLRVGKAGGAMSGLLRRMVENPRTRSGPRGRYFTLDKPFALETTGPLPTAEFPIPSADGPVEYSKNRATLGFDVTVREAKEGGVLVKVVPHARFRDAGRLLAGDLSEGDQGTDPFPAAGFEVALSANDYLVIGTDFYRTNTFGSAALVGEKDGEPVQRLLVIWAGLTKGSTPVPEEDRSSARPLAAQASTTRAVGP